jgi:molybdate transport system substrate-binding protein
MKSIRFVSRLVLCVWLGVAVAQAESVTIAAAADLKFAMEELVANFKKANPNDQVEVVYGSSGKALTQIQQGAPYDLYFSADIAFPEQLVAQGFAVAPVRPYAIGRLVLWSAKMDASKLALADLGAAGIKRVAIANPKHAPYGQKAQEAMVAVGVWNKVEPKIVYGENIAQTAQFVFTGNADVGILALSLVLSPELAAKGKYALIADSLHKPLEQGYVVIKRAKDNAMAKRFADFMGGATARATMRKFGFSLPGEP